MFASIIAPFGGFFASGFKRGFKIKDFGDSIPGHGGMTDRMDCQVRRGLECIVVQPISVAPVSPVPTHRLHFQQQLCEHGNTGSVSSIKVDA